MWRHLLNRRCVPRVVSLSQPLYSGCLSPVACVVHCNDDLGSNYHATSNKYHSLCHSGVSGRTSFCDDSSKTRLLLSQQDHTLSYSQRRGKKTKKERKKQDQKQKQKDLKDEISDDEKELEEDMDVVTKYKKDLQLQLDHLKDQYVTQFGLRTNISSYDTIPVQVDRSRVVPLNQLAQILQKSPQLIHVNMAASPQYVVEIKTALMKSSLNINPQQEGTSLFITVPKVTKEHRMTLSKNAKVVFNDVKDKMLKCQTKELKTLKGNKSLSEDVVWTLENEIKKTTEVYSTKAKDMMTKKQKELMGES